MKITVLGTGMVGRAHAAKLAELGHEVVIGTSDVVKTIGRTEPDAMGNPPYKEWQQQHKQITLLKFGEAAAHGEIIFEALKGEKVVEVVIWSQAGTSRQNLD